LSILVAGGLVGVVVVVVVVVVVNMFFYGRGKNCNEHTILIITSSIDFLKTQTRHKRQRKGRRKKPPPATQIHSLTRLYSFQSTHTYIQQQQQQQTSKLMTAEVLTVDEKDTSFL
jgi:rhamnose utilization protein RhaD (predicted bifunctional aldolase and dehydrogenase)